MKQEKELKVVTSFVIDRQKWAPGLMGQCILSKLLNSDNGGKMCCLGFYGKACGIPNEKLENANFLTYISEDKQFDWLKNASIEPSSNSWGTLERDLALINDRLYENEPNREEKIKSIFADNGITVNFIH